MKRDKAFKDPRGGHVRIYWNMIDSPAWRAMTHADVRIYLAMRRKLGMTNNGDINAVRSNMAQAGLKSSSTLSTGLQRLEILGFIAKTRQGGIAFGGKLCSLYRFTDDPTYDIPKAGVKAGPATNDWAKFKNIGEARAAVRHLSRQNKSKLRTSNRSGLTSEPESKISDSTVGQEEDSLARTSKRKLASEIFQAAA
jgi:hypothetical protein